MKNFFILLAFVFLIHNQTMAQPVGWYWAKSVVASNDSYSNGITTDVFGNVYVTGTNIGTTISFGTTTMSNTAGGIYIVKYDGSGNILWANPQVGIGNATSYGISSDLNGNVFVVGRFSGTSMVFGPYTLTCAGVNDLFVVKFDPNGNVLWAKSEGGSGSEYGKSISTDASGNVFVTGYSKSSSLTVGTYTLNNTAQTNALVIKYDPYGFVLWAKSAGGSNLALWDEGTSISADANGNALLTGFFRNSSITFGTFTLTNAGTNDLFIAKFDPNGNVLWAKSAGGSLSDGSGDISSNTNGDIFLTGSFQSALIGFGTYTLANSNTVIPASFVAKYDASGNALWAKTFGQGGGYSICNDSGGNAFVTGNYDGASLVFGTSTLTSNGPSDIFVVKYDALGNELSSILTGGISDDHAQAIAVDGTGNVFITGKYNSPTVMFSATTLSNANTTYSNVFVSRLGLCGGAPLSPNDITPSSNKFVCEGSSSTLSVTGNGIINWYSSPTSTTALANGYNYMIPSLSVGNYTYYTEANTCTNSISRTAITVTVDACLGLVNLIGPKSTLSVYPNPFQDKLQINGGELMVDKLSIINSLGETILLQNNYNTSQELDVNMLPRGVYFLKVECKNEQSVVKIIKE